MTVLAKNSTIAVVSAVAASVAGEAASVVDSTEEMEAPAATGEIAIGAVVTDRAAAIGEMMAEAAGEDGAGSIPTKSFRPVTEKMEDLADPPDLVNVLPLTCQPHLLVEIWMEMDRSAFMNGGNGDGGICKDFWH